MAAAMHKLNDIFAARTHFQDNIIWRYFGTNIGVHLTYPGIELPTLYDPTIRSW